MRVWPRNEELGQHQHGQQQMFLLLHIITKITENTFGWKGARGGSGKGFGRNGELSSKQ